MDLEKQNTELIQTIITLIDNTRKRVAKTVNSELTMLYWLIGKQINENILHHKRAEYGQKVIKEISRKLTYRYGRGFSKRNLHNFMQFNKVYPDEQIVHALSTQLSRTHLRNIIYIDLENELPANQNRFFKTSVP